MHWRFLLWAVSMDRLQVQRFMPVTGPKIILQFSFRSKDLSMVSDCSKWFLQAIAADSGSSERKITRLEILSLCVRPQIPAMQQTCVQDSSFTWYFDLRTELSKSAPLQVTRRKLHFRISLRCRSRRWPLESAIIRILLSGKLLVEGQQLTYSPAIFSSIFACRVQTK